MSKPTKKQFKITVDQIARGMNYFEELDIPFVVIFDGIPTPFSNCKPLHRDAIVERAYLLACKLAEYEVEAEADKQTAFQRPDED